MKEHIEFPEVIGVRVAVVQDPDKDNDWYVYILNQNEHPLVNVLVSSKGYSPADAEEPQKTGVLRHMIGYIEPQGHAVVERIDPAVFHLVNEYWVSYYTSNFSDKIFDKKFVFLPETIVAANLSYISQLEKQGVVHE